MAVASDVVVDVQVYDASGVRRSVPGSMVESVEWELLQAGNYGRCTVRLADGFDAEGVTAVAGGDRVDVYADSVLRYRGYVAVPQQDLDLHEARSIVAYGLGERLNTIRVGRTYVYPLGTDVSTIASALAQDCLSPRISGLQTDIQSVGFTVKSVDLTGAYARDALDQLVKLCGGRAVWGFDVTSGGANRLFFRPKGTATSYRFRIGDRVRSYSYPPDYSRIVNTVHLVGGETQFPNLVSNGSFEKPKAAGQAEGNLVSNSSFEYSLGGNWQLEGCYQLQADATRIARSGNYLLQMEDVGEYALQPDRNLTAGKEYMLEIWQMGPTSPYAPRFHIEVTPNVGSVIRYPTSGSIASVGAYQRCYFTFTAPSGASSCSVKIACDSEVGIAQFFDDVSLFQTDKVVQEGWTSAADAGVTNGLADWTYSADRKHGSLCVRLSATVPSGKYVYLRQYDAARINVKSPLSYQMTCWARSLSGTVSVTPVMWVNKQSGEGRWVEASAGAFSVGTSGWTQLSWGTAGWCPEADDSTVMVGLRFGSTFDVIVDAVYFGEWNYADSVPAVFMPERNHEWTFCTDDAFVQNDSATPAIVKGSVSTFGVREAEESVEGLVELTSAQNWALGYFGSRAQPTVSHRIEVENCTEDVKLDGLVLLDGSSIPAAFPAAVRFRYGASGILSASMDLATERPTFEGLLQAVANAAKFSRT